MNRDAMTNLSVRLTPEIERGLDQEAALSGKSRSDLVREAVGEYVTRKERERFLSEIAEEMRRGYADANARREAVELDADTSADGVQALIGEEIAAGIDPNEKWWK